MGSSVRAGGWVTIDTRDLRGLVKAARAIEPGVTREMVRGLREGGKVVARDAAGRAGWSARIPGSIRVRVSGASVSVVAGGQLAPHAAAFEHHGRPGPFRHPVFGHRDRWVSQPSRPFLTPAAAAHHEEIAELIGRSVTKLIQQI